MSFKKILIKTKNGNALTKEEEIKLFKKLGLRISLMRLIIKLVILLIGGVLIFASLGKNVIAEEKNALFLLVGIFFISFFIYSFLFHPYHKRINKYLESEDEFLKKRFSKYLDFTREYVDIIAQPNSYFQKKRLMFFTDGYNFLLFDDYLMDTKHKLGRKYRSKKNQHPVLRIFDAKAIEKSRVLFQTKDIISFKCIIGSRKQYKKYKKVYLKKSPDKTLFESYLYTKPCLNKNLINYVELVLQDNMIIKFDIKMYFLLKEVVPNKEIR